MKRILSFLSLMVLAIFTMTSCKGEPTEDELFASDLVNSIMLSQEDGVADEDFSLVAELTRDKVKYEVSWASNNASIKVGTEPTNSAYKASVNRNIDKEVTVKLTATVKVNKAKASKNFNVTVQPYDVFDYLEEYKFPLDKGNVTDKQYVLDSEFKANGAEKAAKITWETNSDLITITTNSEGKQVATAVKTLVKTPAQFTATFTYGEEVAKKSYDVNVLDSVVYTEVTKVAADTEYYLGLVQKNMDSKYLWANGKKSTHNENIFAATSDDLANAITFKAELVEGGFNLTTTIDGAKKYLNAAAKTVTLDAEAKTVFTIDTANRGSSKTPRNAITYLVGKTTYFLGTRDNYDTMSANDSKYIDKDNNYLSHLYSKEEVESLKPNYSDELIAEYELNKAVESFAKGVNGGSHKLPTKGNKYTQVALSYAVTANDNAKYDNGYLKINTLTEKGKTFELTITAKSGEYENSKKINVTINVTPVLTIKEVVSSDNGTAFFVTGKVVAIKFDGYVIEDATGAIIVDTGDDGAKPEIGKTVKVVGTRDDDYKNPLVKPAGDFTVVEDLVYTAPTAKVYTKTELDASLTKNPVCEYITISGTIKVSGSFLNLNLKGTNNFISIVADSETKAQLTKLNGLEVTLTGYTGGTNTHTHYLRLIVTGYEDTSTAEQKFAVAVDAVKNALPTATLVAKTDIELPKLWGVTLTVTAANTLAWNAETSTLTVTPTETATKDDITIVVTLGESTETITAKISSKIITDADCDTFELTGANSGFDPAKGNHELNTFSVENVKFAFTAPEGSYMSKFYTKNNAFSEFRFYGNNTLKISTNNNKKIAKVVIKCKYDDGIKDLTTKSGEITADVENKTATWTGLTDTVDITVSGKQVKFLSIQVFYLK